MPIFNNILAGASGQTGGAPTAYTISRSLRFNSGDSAYLSKVFSSAGNRRTWTYSFWVKKAAPGGGDGNGYLSSATTVGSTTPMFVVRDPNDQLDILNNTGGGSTNFRLTTTAVYRDFSAWYHILLAIDTTQATASNRAKLYVNGAEVTQFSTATYPAQNTDLDLNGSITHNIGREAARSNYYSNFFLADVHFIDGQALDPTSFGEFDEYNNWQPKAYTGTYGTNGFKLDFSDATSTTTIAEDSSGNNNDWTANNLVVNINPIYSNYTTASPGFNPSYPVTRMFDGSDATEAITSNATGAGSITFIPATAVAYTSGVEVYNATGPSAITATLNGGSPITLTSLGWNSIASGTGSITSLVFNRSNGSVAVGGIRINGTLLLTDGVGAGNDSLRDSPTNSGTDTGAGGEVSGGYCCWNPLDNAGTLTNGNLDFSQASAAFRNVRSTFAVSSGKWYWEGTLSAIGGAAYIGIGKATASLTVNIGGSDSWGYVSNGNKQSNNTAEVSYGSSYTSGDVIGVEFDADNGTLVFYKNGTSQGTAFTGLTSGPYFFMVTGYNGTTWAANFGQRPFAYTAPSGFKALCTQNLDDPTIADGSTAMDVALYTGNGTSQTISGLGFSSDLIWTSVRDLTGYYKYVVDSVRGSTKYLVSFNTNAEGTDSQGITSITSDGFTVGSSAQVNENGRSMVAWTWDGGSSTVSNTDGSITSSVRANASAGFSIVTYTGQVSAGSIGHGLNAAPSLIITKARSNAQSWGVYHASTGINNYLLLDSTSAATAYSGIWGSSAPTSTVFNVPGNVGLNNYGSWTYVAYCFAPVEGYSAFGSYTGNGSSDGPFVYTGFRPKFLLVKGNATIDWIIEDSSRDPFNQMNKRLYPNDSVAESTSSNGNLDFLSNGFKPRTSHASLNSSGTTYIYAAFAEHPFRTSRAR